MAATTQYVLVGLGCGSKAQIGGSWYEREPGLSPASGFEHPASTLPTRFPAALDIGHGLPAA